MKLASLVLLGASACGGTTSAIEPEPGPPSVATSTQVGAGPEIDPRFVDAIRAATPAYVSWGRVDELPRVAPALCDMVSMHPDGKASEVRLSAAADSPHDQKLYFLWTNNRERYLGQLDAQQPFAAGFTIVKESFHVEVSTPGAAVTVDSRKPDDYTPPPPVRTLQVDGRTVTTGAPAGLYVVTKVGAPDAAGTDQGWVYGTITVDGTVTSAGRVASCMGCHESATHERLFGLK